MTTSKSDKNISINPIQEINVPVPSPGFNTSSIVKNTINKIAGWVSPYVPKQVMDKINNAYEKYIIRPSREIKTASKSTVRENKSVSKSSLRKVEQFKYRITKSS